MRFLSDFWGSGPREFGITEGHRNFAVTTGADALTLLASCGCPGCMTSMERKLTNLDSSSPQGEDNLIDGGGIQFDETSGVDSVGNTTGTAGALAIGSSTNGWVNTAGDDDWYAVTLVAGQSYTFTMVGGTLEDAYLEIRNSAGTLIGFDDDFGSQYNATLRWTATESGTYYINARAWEPDPGQGSPSLTGSYTLTAATSAPASPLDAIDYHYTMPTTSISVWFATTGYTNPSGDAVVRNWTQTEINAVMAALGTYSAITPLTFSIAPSQGAATWIFSLADLPGNTLGYFAVGNQYAAFDPNVSGFTAGLVPGGNSWITVLHEAGHGLGMAHPHDQGAINYGTNNSEVMQGVLDPFNSLGTFGLNVGLYTTMTYNDSAQSTPMALDVALMQQRYGVNPNTGAGNTAYTLSLTASSYICIWDVSGADTISYAGSNAATIDLRAATLLNAVGGGGYVSSVQGVLGGFTIANGVVIENATGGSGNDTLIGNSAANILTGGAGADTMTGGAGDDTYFVDNAGDVVIEASNEGVDTVNSSRTYVLGPNVENLTLLSSAIEVHGSGNALNNVISGNENGNLLQGLDGNDRLVGNGGNDQLVGGDGVDTAGYAIASTSATWTRNPNGTWTVTGEGTDTLTSLEHLDFTDRDVFLDRAFATFTGDGTSDVLFHGANGQVVRWSVLGTTLQSGSYIASVLPSDWTALGIGDFNGDGRDDVVWRQSTGQVLSWQMNGSAISSAQSLASLGAEWSFLGVADLNGDLRDDIVWRNSSSGLVYSWETSASGALASGGGIATLSAEWILAGIGDFDSDGRDDFLWRNSTSNQTVMWDMNGRTIGAGASTSAQVGAEWTIQGIGDFNGDGRDDILWMNTGGGVVVWHMNGATLLGGGYVASLNPSEWSVVNIGDYNGDGRDDILWQNSSGTVFDWIMNGTTITSAGALGTVAPGEWEIIGGG